MKVAVNSGKTIEFANSSGSKILAGAVVVVGERIGVAVTDIADGSSGTVAMEGVLTIAKHAGLAITQGAKVFYDTTALEIVAAPTANAKIAAGFAATAAASGDSTVDVILDNIAKRGAAVADVATADGSDAGTTQTLANALKVKVNAMLASLRAAGIIET